MRILLLLNNWAGWKVGEWLRQRSEEIAGVVLNAPHHQRFGHEILSTLALPSDKIWTADQLREQHLLAKLRELRAEMAISVFFGSILKPEVIEMFPKGCINLHAAFLPYNRGWHTNVWPIIENTPAGATVHYIDRGVDTGDIIAQRRITVEPTDTGGSLHEKTVRADLEVFKETWPLIRGGKNSRTPQDHTKATSHRRADLVKINAIDLERTYRAGDLINLIRAQTYSPYPSAYYNEGEKRTYVRVTLARENQLVRLEVPQSVKEMEPLDLSRQYRAKDLLELLGIHKSSPNHFVKFAHESGPFFVRAYLTDEREFDPDGVPPWMGNP